MTTAPIYSTDLEIGETFMSAGVTVTEAHVVNFAGLTGDMNPLHMDARWAAEEGPFDQRIAHGMLGAALVSGLRCKLDDLALIAFLGIQDWRFKQPIFIGDSIRARMTLASLRPTSTAGRSVLTVGVEVLNQEDEIVQTGSWAMMLLDAPGQS
jgi:3-hydroxybutyryl-CoA dehydratase